MEEEREEWQERKAGTKVDEGRKQGRSKWKEGRKGDEVSKEGRKINEQTNEDKMKEGKGRENEGK